MPAAPISVHHQAPSIREPRWESPVARSVALALARNEGREHGLARISLRESLAAHSVPAIVEFLAAEGIRFSGRPKRAEVVAEVLEAFMPEPE